MERCVASVFGNIKLSVVSAIPAVVRVAQTLAYLQHPTRLASENIGDTVSSSRGNITTRIRRDW
jgi:hypothetical protein